jgi:N-acetylglucosaminyl-diphospho-decaprenol L-rhamnosyltransferase
MRPDVAAVIGNHQGEAVLDDCLASLSRQIEPIRETLVVDGASTDGSRAVAGRHGARFLAVSNRGLGFLYNHGVEATDAEYVLLLNNDVALDPSCTGLLVAELRARESRFAADPTQLSWDGDAVIHARTILRPGRLVGEHIPGLHLDDRVRAEAVAPTVSAHGAAMLVRRSMFVELGGFDETFFMEWEDLDLCWRAWLRGWESVYVPEARVRHRVGAVTTAAVAPRRATSSHHNMMRFACKCLPPPAVARVLTGESLRLLRHPRIIASATAATAREAREIVALRRSLEPSRALYDRLLAL